MEKLYEILENIRPEINFKEASNFIENDILDSLDIIKLVVALEEEFSISIDAEEVVPENFESIQFITKLIVKLGGVI
ncbi:MAG: acyl carrier protein [Flavobacteriales bacterium]|nr:acyl carrier protein [Flavobacteriales bacterium]